MSDSEESYAVNDETHNNINDEEEDDLSIDNVGETVNDDEIESDIEEIVNNDEVESDIEEVEHISSGSAPHGRKRRHVDDEDEEEEDASNEKEEDKDEEEEEQVSEDEHQKKRKRNRRRITARDFIQDDVEVDDDEDDDDYDSDNEGDIGIDPNERAEADRFIREQEKQPEDSVENVVLNEDSHTFAPDENIENVEVTDGELVNLQGEVPSDDANKVDIVPENEEMAEPLTLNANELRKYFKEGDHVRVINGRYEGDTGLVLKVEENLVILLSDLTRDELKVLPNDLRDCSDVPAAVNSVNPLSASNTGDINELFQIKLNEMVTEKNFLAYEKERLVREKEILIRGKQWYINEISKREIELNEMRIQMTKMEAKMTRETTLLSDERDSLSIKVNELTETLKKKETELIAARGRIHTMVEDRATTLNEMDAELRAKERLCELYKSTLEVTRAEVVSLKENDERLQNALRESETSIANLKSEIEDLKQQSEKEVSARENSIKNLKEELSKANDLLQAHRSGDNIAALSPSAAIASNFIRSGVPLSSIYAEHCRVVAELEKKTAEVERIESYVTELIQELDKRAPHFRELNEAYEKAVKEISRVNLQCQFYSDNYNKLLNERDAIANELLAKEKSLQMYQHEHYLLNCQVRRLLFNIERKNCSDKELNVDAEEFLFRNICELQQANLKLLRRVKELELANAEAICNEHKAENEMLKITLELTKKDLENLRESYVKSSDTIKQLTAERDEYKTRCEDFENNMREDSLLQSKTVLTAEIHHWKARVEVLQEKLEYFTEEKQESDRAFNERIDQQMEQISELRTTNGKLESDLEYQKKNQQLLNKNLDQLNSELTKSHDELVKVNNRLETLQARNEDINKQLLSQQQEISQLRMMNYTLDEQLQIARSNEHSANEELSILRSTNLNTERAAVTLQGVETILKRLDGEKQSSISSELQVVCLERDNLRILLDNMTRQHADVQAKLEEANSELQSQKDRIATLESEMNDQENTLKQKMAEQEEIQKLLNQIRTIARIYREEKVQLGLKNSQLETSLATVKQEYEQYQTKAESEENTLKEKISQFQAELEKTKNDLEASTEKAEILLNEKIAEIQTNSKNEEIALKEKIEELQAVLDKTKTELRASTEKAEMLMKEKMAETETNVKSEDTELKQRVEELQAELEKTKSELSMLSSSARPAETSVSWTAGGHNEKAEVLLKEKIAEFQALKARFEALEKENLAMKQQLEKMEEEVNESREKILRLDIITANLNSEREKNERLNKQVGEKEAFIAELEQQLHYVRELSS